MISNRYFKKLPYIDYMLGGKTRRMKDITTAIRVIDEKYQKPEMFNYYFIKDGDRPDSIAKKFYNDYDLFWLVLVVNQIFDPLKDFPLSSNEFEDYIKGKYGSIPEARKTIVHYENENGYIVDEDYPVAKRKPVSAYDLEYNENESKREIKLLRRRYMKQFLTDLEAF